MSPHHIVLITSDVIGTRMAGPGIRFWEFARALSGEFRVTLAIPPFLNPERRTPRSQTFPSG